MIFIISIDDRGNKTKWAQANDIRDLEDQYYYFRKNLSSTEDFYFLDSAGHQMRFDEVQPYHFR